jgi:hypothetical protein
MSKNTQQSTSSSILDLELGKLEAELEAETRNKHKALLSSEFEWVESDDDKVY